ncbi:BET1 homolog [Watersipora subatra]|uniref:BET1 homolog n=1 Tax=Watersipora subatra TaxID=2589382 RepID=UPI00355B5232
MRRNFGESPPDGQYSHNHIEDENSRAENELADKVTRLKSLTIDIGDEVRYQNKMLNGIDDDFDRGSGFLGSSMKRLTGIMNSGSNWHLCYLLLFCLCVFFVLWLFLKFR